MTISNAHRVAGGAAISGAVSLKNLEDDFGHECRMFTRAPRPVNRRVEGREVNHYSDLEELKAAVSSWRPDVLIGLLSSASDTTRLASHFGIPGFAYLLSYEFSEPSPEEKRLWGLSEQASFASEAETDWVLDAADRVFVCSRFMQGMPSLRKAGAEVLYPEFDLEKLMVSIECPASEKTITGICGFRNKGIEVFLDLARSFPEESFSLVGELGSDIDFRYRDRIERCGNITLLGREEPRGFLARSRLVLVPSQWPEPFGRIAVEALANGVPVLASQCGGLGEIVRDNRFLVRDFRDIDAWIGALRRILEKISTGKELELPRVDRFLGKESSTRLNAAIEAAVRERSMESRKHVVFHDNRERSAFGLVNAAWSKTLPTVDFRVDHQVESDFGCPDFHIHHNYLLPFMDFDPPPTGKCIAVRTWDFGRFPRRWVEKINAEFDQFWAYSEWIAEQARLSGVGPDRIRVVSLGFDPDMFHPEGEVYPLPVKKRFTFGFVGGAVVRKGVDIILKAYAEAFSSEDDVCLVIKDHSGDLIYEKNDLRAEIRSFIDCPENPALVYIDEFLSDEALASLLRSFDVGVFPYRAEGFCLPILESMACGVPSIAPNLGPCVDFCSSDTSYLVPTLRMNLPVNRKMDLNLGFSEHIDEVDFCEVRPGVLADFMRKAYEASPSELSTLSKNGIERAHAYFTWEKSGNRVLELLQELDDAAVPVRIERMRTQNAAIEKRDTMALELLRQKG